jgi:MFS family permease
VRRLLAFISAILFVDAMLFVAITPLVPTYADEYGLSDSAAGWLVAAFGIGAAIGGIPCGFLAMRVGPKATVVVGLLGVSLSSAALALAGDPWALGGARLAQGVSSAAVWTGALAWVTVVTPRGRRGQALGTAFGTAIAGAIIGPMLGGLADVVGARPAFGSVTIIAFALAVATTTVDAAPPEQQRPGATRAVLRDPGYLVGIWLNFLIEFLFATMALLVPLALDDNGFSAIQIGIVFFVTGTVEVVLNPLVGIASDRRGRLLPLRAALIAASVTWIGLALAESSTAIVLLVWTAAFGLGTMYSPAMALVADRAEAAGLAQGFGFGVMNSFWALGLIVAPPLAGALSESYGDYLPYMIGAVLSVLTLIGTARPVRRRLAAA